MKVILKRSEELILVGDKHPPDQHGSGLWAKLLTLFALLIKLVDVVCTHFHNYFDDLTSSKQAAIG